MNTIFRDYERPSIYLREKTGYIDEIYGNDFNGEYFKIYAKDQKVNNIDGITYIKAENNLMYFHEANCLMKINANENNYFDFSKAIIDIGAHAGCYSFRSEFKHIYAFEPNERYYHILCVNLMFHEKYDISEVYNVALSDKHEIIEFDGFRGNTEDIKNISFGELVDCLTTGYIKNIETHLLDEYHCENVGLIKVDVEGMDEKVLRGGINTIKNNNYPPILFELWDVGFNDMTEERHNSMINFLNELGYEIIWKYGDDMTHLAIHK